MLQRTKHIHALKKLLRRYPVVGILGPRQVGKTTLANLLSKRQKQTVTHFDLENPEDLSRLQDPILALKPLKGLIVLDEIQRLPEIFPTLRVLADRPKTPARFLLLGSASPKLLKQSSESLAGRIAYHALEGFSLEEVGTKNLSQLWLRGGFPKAYLSKTATESLDWRLRFIKTFLERDLPQMGITIPAITLHRFWMMLSHYHGQTWNSSEFSRAFGVADTTVRNYLDLLSSALVVRQLPAWYENISKRQVKAPKFYISDSGILHALLNLKTIKALTGHPKVGASWEGFLLGQITQCLNTEPEHCFYWKTHAGAELDLLILKGQQRLGFEIKRTSSPKITPSMTQALKDLKLKKLFIIHAGEKSFSLTSKIEAISSSHILETFKKYR